MVPQNQGLDDSPPPQGSNRAFGLVFAAVFTLIALWPLLDSAPIRVWAMAVGGVFLGVALALPAALSPLNTLWHRFGLLLGAITSPIVMGVLFFAAVTPIGLLMRAFGKDNLGLRRDPAATTYWVERSPPGPSGDSLRNQF